MSPEEVMSEDLIGSWKNESGTWTFFKDGTYRFVGSSQRPGTATGRWLLIYSEAEGYRFNYSLDVLSDDWVDRKRLLEMPKLDRFRLCRSNQTLCETYERVY